MNSFANPPFNDSDWFRKDDDVRWQFGVPPKGNANFAWVQHFIHHLAPQGMAGFVLANGSMSSNQSGEGDIRRAPIEADLVDCKVALSGQLFYSTQIPVCLWFLAKNKNADVECDFRDHRQLIEPATQRPMSKIKRSTIEVQGTAISILSQPGGDYISLTDMVRNFDGAGALIEQ